MTKKEKRYVFCIERFVNGHPVDPIYIFYNIKLHRFVTGNVVKRDRFNPSNENLRIVVSTNPNDIKEIERIIKLLLKRNVNYPFEIGKAFPVKCDSLKCRYQVSTKNYIDYDVEGVRVTTSKFIVKA